MRKVGKLLGFSLLVTVVVAGVLNARFRSPGPAIAAPLTSFLVYTLIISGLCWAVMPILGKWTEHKPLVLRWSILVGALLVLGTVGTAIAAAVIYYAFGRQPFVVFGLSLATALPITVVVGVVTTLIVSNKERLEISRAALQTQRLERERAEKLAAEAQLASLSSRVQPHFLFNTLNSIAALIRENPEQAEQTVERLASLLRSSLDQTPTIPLEQEIKLVRDYLEIQKTRLGERLHFEIAVEPGLQAAVPPFSVQTLVENSVKHVAGQRREGVDLQIRASRFGDHVIVFVTDNGPGFDAGSMKAGRGLDNLQARLRAVHGDRAGLEFLREPGRMIVRMRVPLG
jgi:two-component system sensor histidine kinase AlgZ